MKACLISLVIFVMLFSACDDKMEKNHEKLNISGTVIDKIDKLPIEGATVYVERANLMAMDIVDTTIYTSTTGGFDYTLYPAVSFSYQLDIRKEGYYGLTKVLDLEMETQEVTIELERYP